MIEMTLMTVGVSEAIEISTFEALLPGFIIFMIFCVLLIIEMLKLFNNVDDIREARRQKIAYDNWLEYRKYL